MRTPKSVLDSFVEFTVQGCCVRSVIITPALIGVAESVKAVAKKVVVIQPLSDVILSLLGELVSSLTDGLYFNHRAKKGHAEARPENTLCFSTYSQNVFKNA
jgi:hypothetical protein